MTDWQVIFLGVMAVSLVLMAVAQLVVALALVKAVKKVSDSVDQLQRDIRPVLDKAVKIADDASRVASLALVQAERLNTLMASSAARVDETFQVVQRAITEPIRHGSALFAAMRAAFSVVRSWQARPSAAAATMSEDDDPLFVG